MKILRIFLKKFYEIRPWSINKKTSFLEEILILSLSRRLTQYDRGLRLKSIEGPHLDGKCLRGLQFKIRMALRAAMWKNMPYLVQNLVIYLIIFWLSLIKIYNFVGLKESCRPHSAHGPRVLDPCNMTFFVDVQKSFELFWQNFSSDKLRQNSEFSQKHLVWNSTLTPNLIKYGRIWP